MLAIKQTLYRTSRNSPVVQSLIEAAERGKQVAVLVELKASFDEARNIEWAEALEGAGAHVAYGVRRATRRTPRSRWWCARRPMACAPTSTSRPATTTPTPPSSTPTSACSPATRELAADTAQLFNLLTSGHIGEQRFDKLVVAPVNMRRRVLELIAREAEHQRAGLGGRIVAKMNSLEDPEIVRALYDASRAGVEIDLIVRGVCRLRPGVPGMSETIRVRSIVGRFLEHARIFYFAQRRRRRVLHRLGRLDVAQSRLSGRDDGAGRVARAAGRARRGSSTCSSPTTARPGSSSRTALAQAPAGGRTSRSATSQATFMENAAQPAGALSSRGLRRRGAALVASAPSAAASRGWSSSARSRRTARRRGALSPASPREQARRAPDATRRALAPRRAGRRARGAARAEWRGCGRSVWPVERHFDEPQGALRLDLRQRLADVGREQLTVVQLAQEVLQRP